MKNKKILLITIATLFFHLCILGMKEDQQCSVGLLLEEYSQVYNQFKGLNFTNPNTVALFNPNKEHQAEEYPFQDKYDTSFLPDKYKDILFENDEQKTDFAKTYFSELKSILEDNARKSQIIQGKIRDPYITNAIYQITPNKNEKEDNVIKKIQAAALNTLPKCYSTYKDFNPKVESENYNATLLDRIYTSKKYLREKTNMENLYNKELEDCNKYIIEQNHQKIAELTNPFIEYAKEIKEAVEKTKHNIVLWETMERKDVSFYEAIDKELDELEKKVNQYITKNEKSEEFINWLYPRKESTKRDIKLIIKKTFEGLKKTNFNKPEYKHQIINTFKQQYLFYKKNNIDENLLKEYKNNLQKIEDNIRTCWNLAELNFSLKHINMWEFKTNILDIKKEIMAYAEAPILCSDGLSKLIELDNIIQNQIPHFNLKYNIRIITDNEKIISSKKDAPPVLEKPFYTGAFAHLSNAHTYNLSTKQFEPLNIATGIVHASGISFETDESPWFNYYIKKSDKVHYEFKINTTKDDDDATKVEKIKKRMEELYEDIHTRIFDIFAAAFELAKKNNKSELHIKMPYIGMGNFLNEIKNTDIESFIIGCYYKCFIHNFNHFYENKTNYNIKTFKIFFGDGKNKELSSNNHLKEEFETYLEKNIQNTEKKEELKKHFICENDQTELFSIKEYELMNNNNNNNNNNNKLLIFVRPGDEYANYLNGGLVERNSLELKFLGMPAYKTYPEIIFPEAPALAVLSPLLPLQLLANNCKFEKQNNIIPYNINAKKFINSCYKKESQSYGIINLQTKNGTASITKKSISLPSFQSLISGVIIPPTEGLRGEKSTPKLKLYIDHKNFKDSFLKIIDGIITNHDKKKGEILININSLLDKYKESSLFDILEKLIHNEITDIITENKYKNTIKFIYDGFYIYQANKILNTDAGKNEWFEEKFAKMKIYDKYIKDAISTTPIKKNPKSIDYTTTIRDLKKRLNTIKKNLKEGYLFKINTEDKTLHKALEQIQSDELALHKIVHIITHQDSNENKTLLEKQLEEAANSKEYEKIVKKTLLNIIGYQIQLQEPDNSDNITYITETGIVIPCQLLETLGNIAEKEKNPEIIKQLQELQKKTIQNIFSPEDIEKNEELPKHQDESLISNKNEEENNTELNLFFVEMTAQEMAKIPEYNSSFKSEESEESEESKVPEESLQPQNNKPPRWLKYLTGIAALGALGALCIIFVKYKYKYNSISEATENSFLAKIFGKKA
jgi:hypothetical protein